MQRLTAGLLILLLLTLSSAPVEAAGQESAQQRGFKSWTVETKTIAKEQPQWKHQLAAKALQKKKESLQAGMPTKVKPVPVEQTNSEVMGTDSKQLQSSPVKNVKSKLKEKIKKQQFKKKRQHKPNGAQSQKQAWQEYSLKGIKALTGREVIREAAKYKGVRYRFGGTTPKGFDCSGYVQYVFKRLHASLSRTADTQAREGVFITQRQLKPGDLVFFSTYERGASHVGIYAGNGNFWNATSSRGIMLCRLQDDYWRQRYYGARRVLVTNGEPD